MNNKILIVGVVVVLAIAGLLFVMSRSNTTAPATVENTQNSEATQAVEENTAEITTTVNATSNGFEPQNITIKAGGTVVWTNTSGGMFNVSSNNHPTHLLWSFLNLGSFEDGSSVSVVFEEAGVYKYHNHLNASQTGTVTVE